MAMIKLERFGKGYLENPYNVDTEERASVSVSVCVCVCVCVAMRALKRVIILMECQLGVKWKSEKSSKTPGSR